jgi:hypothetical protein
LSVDVIFPRALGVSAHEAERRGFSRQDPDEGANGPMGSPYLRSLSLIRIRGSPYPGAPILIRLKVKALGQGIRQPVAARAFILPL